MRRRQAICDGLVDGASLSGYEPNGLAPKYTVEPSSEHADDNARNQPQPDCGQDRLAAARHKSVGAPQTPIGLILVVACVQATQCVHIVRRDVCGMAVGATCWKERFSWMHAMVAVTVGS